MSKIPATEIRAGYLIEWDKRIWRVLKCYHVHVGGRGGAFMQVEMKDIEAGTKTNQRIRSEDKVDLAIVELREMIFLYQEGKDYIFMDQRTYEQVSLPQSFLEEQTGYLLPDTEVQISFHDERPIGVQLPSSVILTVMDTEPNLRRATATSSYKPATVETGLIVMVPPFVSQRERIKINTDTGEYIERA